MAAHHVRTSGQDPRVKTLGSRPVGSVTESKLDPGLLTLNSIPLPAPGSTLSGAPFRQTTSLTSDPRTLYGLLVSRRVVISRISNPRRASRRITSLRL